MDQKTYSLKKNASSPPKKNVLKKKQSEKENAVFKFYLRRKSDKERLFEE